MRGRAALCFVLVPAIAWGGGADTGGQAPGGMAAAEGPALTREEVKRLRTLLNVTNKIH